MTRLNSFQVPEDGLLGKKDSIHDVLSTLSSSAHCHLLDSVERPVGTVGESAALVNAPGPALKELSFTNIRTELKNLMAARRLRRKEGKITH